MDRIKDPVCGMMVDPNTAAAHTSYESREIYFCSEDCHRAFRADPEVSLFRYDYVGGPATPSSRNNDIYSCPGVGKLSFTFFSTAGS